MTRVQHAAAGSRELHASGLGILKIGRTLPIGTSVVQRLVVAARSATV
jgi:hypothetical protein